MILSENWLREWLALDSAMTQYALGAKITSLGLEVDAISSAAPEFTGVLVAEISAIATHPSADKLNVCQVNIGTETLQIVCGAANARAGIKVPLATVGAVLPENFKIKAAKLRGVESMGMLCSAAELGLSENADGLLELPADAPIGSDLREYMQLDDHLFDIDLTPNRGDCLSVLGVARELANSLQQSLQYPQISSAKVSANCDLKIDLQAKAHCPRYTGRAVIGIDPKAQSPMWLRERLRRAGIRPLYVAVDVGNYVMLELGQPMHAFDLDKLTGDITVRLAQAGEKIELLDDSSRELDATTLVIADAAGAQAIAGVMGAKSSAVDANTCNIFFESAFFSPEKLIGKPRQYQLHTDSSHRFERGVDPSLQLKALERATELLLNIAGGSAAQIQEVCASEWMPTAVPIILRQSRVERLLGFGMDASTIESDLRGLGIELELQAAGIWRATAPAHRFDLAIEADLIEELVRLYGYENIHRHQTHSSAAYPINHNSNDIDQILVERGYQQAICYSFIDPKRQQLFEPHQNALALANPISQDMAVMRTSLLPALVDALQYNLNRQQKNIRLFESGLVFLQDEPDASLANLRQQKQIAAVVSGARREESWHQDAVPLDFFDIKADVEALLASAGGEFVFERSHLDYLHSGQSATIYKLLGDKKIAVGNVGALHPQLLHKLKIKQNVLVFELEHAAIWQQKPVAQFSKLSEFPARRRDLAVVVDEKISAQCLVQAIWKAAPAELQSLSIFDIYQGDKLESGSKSIAFCLILQAFSRTLSDCEVDTAVANILDSLHQQYGATLR